MKAHQFTIVASGIDPTADDFESRLFEAGCDDATVAFQKGMLVLDFERKGRSFAHALVSAIQDARRAGAKVERVEPDPLVSMSEIANRAGLSRAAVSLFSKGRRGADFPLPVARITSDSPLWDWVEVARWMERRGNLDRSHVIEAKVVKAVNRFVSESVVEGEHIPLASVIQRRLGGRPAP